MTETSATATSAMPLDTSPAAGSAAAAADEVQHDPDRVAVVIVHGMGEQQPMGTLRELVNEYLKNCDARTRRMWSVADRYDGSFELHTFVVPPEPDRAEVVARAAQAHLAAQAGPGGARTPRERAANAGGPRGQIDFYEGYWASDLRGTKLAHLVRWLVNILDHIFRHRKLRVVPLRLAWVWVPLLVLPIAFAIALPWVIATYGETTWYLWGSRFVVLAIIPFAANWALRNLGDVARYLDPGPDNVAARHAIRENLVGLLAKLHDGGRYRRIVLIGHSLGGVVAYDALRLLWAQRIRDLDVLDLDQQPLLDTADMLRVADEKLHAAAGRSRRHRTADTTREYEQAQAAYERARAAHLAAQAAAFDRLVDIGRAKTGRVGHAWLVSDLLTLGSPIAYPDLLIAPPGVPVDRLTEERVLPTSPPQLAEELPGQELASTAGVARIRMPEVPAATVPGEDGRYGQGTGDAPDRWGSYTFNSTVDAGPARHIAVFHHGAVFAVTRWTNVYAAADFIGNAIPDSLGPAVVNVRLGQGHDPKSRWARIPVSSHTRYWKEADGQEPIWRVIDEAARDLPTFLPAATRKASVRAGPSCGGPDEMSEGSAGPDEMSEGSAGPDEQHGWGISLPEAAIPRD